MYKKEMQKEKKEAWMRIIVLIVSGIVLMAWRYLVFILVLINFFYTIFTGRRLKHVAELSEIWNTQWYVFQRYMIFLSNKRPFPFKALEKEISKYENR